MGWRHNLCIHGSTQIAQKRHLKSYCLMVYNVTNTAALNTVGTQGWSSFFLLPQGLTANCPYSLKVLTKNYSSRQHFIRFYYDTPNWDKCQVIFETRGLSNWKLKVESGKLIKPRNCGWNVRRFIRFRHNLCKRHNRYPAPIRSRINWWVNKPSPWRRRSAPLRWRGDVSNADRGVRVCQTA